MATEAENAIQIENLTKSFGKFKALDNFSMNLRKGEIYGLIGPNGAGKTTAISILLGILSPDPGSKISIMNFEVPNKLAKIYPLIGYMPQEIALYMDLSINENLEFFGKLAGMPSKQIQSRIKEVLALVDLAEFGNRSLAKCSGGMQRRCSLAAALLHQPKVLILDEPTVGIDPELRNIFWNYFRKIASEEGVSILITTHYLAESLRCDRVGFINKRIIAEGKPIDLQQQVQEAINSSDLPDMERVFIYYNDLYRSSLENSGGN